MGPSMFRQKRAHESGKIAYAPTARCDPGSNVVSAWFSQELRSDPIPWRVGKFDPSGTPALAFSSLAVRVSRRTGGTGFACVTARSRSGSSQLGYVLQ